MHDPWFNPHKRHIVCHEDNFGKVVAMRAMGNIDWLPITTRKYLTKEMAFIIDPEVIEIPIPTRLDDDA